MPNPESKPGFSPSCRATEVVDVDRLPFYQEAADQTGFSLKILAREGEQHIFRSSGFGRPSKKPTTIVTIQQGKVAIAIDRPEDRPGDHTPFWDAYKKLTAPPKPSGGK